MEATQGDSALFTKKKRVRQSANLGSSAPPPFPPPNRHSSVAGRREPNGLMQKKNAHTQKNKIQILSKRSVKQGDGNGMIPPAEASKRPERTRSLLSELCHRRSISGGDRHPHRKDEFKNKAKPVVPIPAGFGRRQRRRRLRPFEKKGMGDCLGHCFFDPLPEGRNRETKH